MSNNKTIPQMFDELKDLVEEKRHDALDNGIELGIHIRGDNEKVAEDMVDELLDDPERFLLQTLLHTYFFDSRYDSKAELIKLMYQIVKDMKQEN